MKGSLEYFKEFICGDCECACTCDKDETIEVSAIPQGYTLKCGKKQQDQATEQQ